MADPNDKQRVEREVADLKSRSSSRDSMNDLRDVLRAEEAKVAKTRQEVADLREKIRKVRKEKSELAVERNKIVENIRALQLDIKESQDIIRQADTPASVKANLKSQIEDRNIALRGYRTDEARVNTQIAQKSTEVQALLGQREGSEDFGSDARRASREAQRQLATRQAAFDQAEKVGPRSLERQFRGAIPANAQLEAARAAQQIGKQGGTADEQKAISEATQAFHELAMVVRDTRKKLADLQEGTDEYASTQEELKDQESKAAEKIRDIVKIETDVGMRAATGASAGGGGGAAGAAQAGLGMAAGAFRFGERAFSELGDRATSRYVLEEQRKQAELQVKAQALADVRNRTTDATALLSTGAGRLAGAEMPYNERGEVTGRVSRLGQDYANTREAVIQQQFLMKAASGTMQLGANVVGAGIKGAGAGAATPWGAAGGAAGGALGEALSGGASLAAQTFQDYATTPEVAGRLGGQRMTQTVRENLEGGMDTFADSAKAMSSALEKGGGDAKKFTKGIDDVKGGVQSLAEALPNAAQRAYESVEQLNKLNVAQQESDQVNRLRERLSVAFAPQLQRLMDVQPTMRAAARSRSMSGAEREAQERQMEGFSVDQELTDRGFLPEDILRNTANSAQRLGRFGAGGMNERVSRSGMMAESMGLGSADQNIAFMGRALQGGVKDPEALFTKAVAEGLKRGLSDSRQFQELLSHAAETSSSASDFSGTLERLVSMTGVGGATDVRTATAAMKGAAQEMSGFQGDWHDTVKFDVTNKAAQKAKNAAAAQGIKLDRLDMTSLQNLANVKPQDLKNPAVLRDILTPQALKALEASGGVEKYGADLEQALMVHGTMDQAINATQDKELAQVRNMLANGDKEGLKRMFSGPGGTEKARRVLSLIGSGMTATGDIDRARGSKNAVGLQLSDALGVSTEDLGLGKRDYVQKTIAQARGDSAPAGTLADQQARAQGAVGRQDFGDAMSLERGANGENLLAGEMGRTGDKYRVDRERVKADVVSGKTVDPRLEVKRADQAVDDVLKGLRELKDSFKNFSVSDMAISVTKDVVISGASAIKGIVLDNGLVQATKAAGEAIVDAVSKGVGGKTSAPAAQPATVPTPPKVGGPIQ